MESNPVSHVTFFGARDYCTWLGDDFSLPTAQEWMRAATMGNTEVTSVGTLQMTGSLWEWTLTIEQDDELNQGRLVLLGGGGIGRPEIISHADSIDFDAGNDTGFRCIKHISN